MKIWIPFRQFSILLNSANGNNRVIKTKIPNNLKALDYVTLRLRNVFRLNLGRRKPQPECRVPKCSLDTI
jgi:hypothetical protein